MQTKIFDLVGKEALKASIISEKQVLEIGSWANSLYFLQLTDNMNGEQIIRKIHKE